MYPLRLVPTADRRPDSASAQAQFATILGAHPAVEHVRVRTGEDSVRLTAFLAAPDSLSALPIITELRSSLTGLDGWQLLPDPDFA